ncbi:hypothetical protein Goklo_024412 [Gossypium klotzschianum]|uniref:Uncharacterized protein n=1 Tax=Gossypium klotzschianum TaxID=34286 RepID=A0A7J8W2M4_9ROSI|nr:hypothetical protein [Gossypium klotzschianum]
MLHMSLNSFSILINLAKPKSTSQLALSLANLTHLVLTGVPSDRPGKR